MAHEANGHDGGSILKVGINLTIACLISGAIIAGTYWVTHPVAVKELVHQHNLAMQELVKDAQDFKPVAGKTDWYAAVKDGKTIAYVVPADSIGYGGTITMITAVSLDGRDLGYKIIDHNETPGLGANATKPQFSHQFIGKKAADLVVVKHETTKNIQAMTGATITSRAVTKGVREAVERVDQYIASQKK